MLLIEDRYQICDENLEIDKLYKAKDLQSDTDIFIKVLKHNKNIKENFVPNLIDEINTILSMDSNKIAKILDIVIDEHNYYIISEYFEGTNLSNLVNNQELKTDDIIYIFRQIVSLMKMCDEKNLYHGALRLDNILVNENYNIKIYDFGITKANSGVNLRMNENISFLCPHQLNVNYTDKESDFFAIGIIMYYCILKKMPFKIEKDEFKMLKNIDKGINFEKETKTPFNKDLMKIIKKLLDRKEKYKSYSDILIDLTKIMYANANIIDTNNISLKEKDNYIKSKKKNSFLIKLISLIMCIVILIMIILQL